MRRFTFVMIIFLVFLVQCGQSSSTTTQGIIDMFKFANINIDDSIPLNQGDDALKDLYKDQSIFQVVDNNQTRTGGVFICENKQKCDTLYAGLSISDAVYTFRSHDGTVICTIQRELSATTIAQFQK